MRVKAEAIIGTILLRERHRRDRLHYLLRVTVAVVTLVVFLAVVAAFLLARGPLYKYVMVDPTGRLIQMVPLSQPNHDDAAILSWTVDAVTRIYTFDFANFRRQFQNSQALLTQIGFANFERSLRESGNFVAVRENRYVTTAVPNGPPRLLASNLVTSVSGESRWGWVVEFPMLLTYRSSKQSTTQELNVRTTVVRVPEYINRQGLGIRQVIAE